MKNRNIAVMLRYYRKLNNLTVKEVSTLLKEHNVKAAEKTIYAWENATTQPSADTLMTLCEIYEIPNVLEAFGYTNLKEGITCTLTPEENHIISEYRKHPEMHNAIKQLLGITTAPETDSVSE